MIESYFKKIVNRNDLKDEEMTYLMENIMKGNISETMVGSILTALSMKGESIEEITAAARVMRKLSEKININHSIRLDTCGTGGDESGSYNVSTGTAFVLASGGVHVLKHGNRSVTSKCGSADVLEALGANINLNPMQVEEMVNNITIGFLFAPTFHKAMKFAAPIRKILGIKTIFNILGPLTNPGHANYQIVGVYKPELTEQVANVLNNLGSERALVVHGMEGLDEISIIGETKVTELNKGTITTYYIKPEDFGLQTGSLSEISGGNKEENGKILKSLFHGEKGVRRNFLLLNSGAAFYVTGKSKDIYDGIKMAEELIDSGKTLAKLNEYINYTQMFSKKEELA